MTHANLPQNQDSGNKQDTQISQSEIESLQQNQYSAIQLLNLMLANSGLPQKVIELAGEYNLDKDQFLVCLAINILEALDNDAPEERAINIMETLLLDWYASKSETIENIITR